MAWLSDIVEFRHQGAFKDTQLLKYPYTTKGGQVCSVHDGVSEWSFSLMRISYEAEYSLKQL